MTLQKTLEEFDDLFYMYNPKNDKGTHIPTWNGEDYYVIKQFLTQAIREALEEVVPDICPIGGDYQNHNQHEWKREGYNKCIDQIKDNIKKYNQ